MIAYLLLLYNQIFWTETLDDLSSKIFYDVTSAIFRWSWVTRKQYPLSNDCIIGGTREHSAAFSQILLPPKKKKPPLPGTPSGLSQITEWLIKHWSFSESRWPIYDQYISRIQRTQKYSVFMYYGWIDINFQNLPNAHQEYFDQLLWILHILWLLYQGLG